MSNGQKGGMWRRLFGGRAEDREPAPETETPEETVEAPDTPSPDGTPDAADRDSGRNDGDRPPRESAADHAAADPSGAEPRAGDPAEATVEPVMSGFEPEAPPEPVDEERAAPADTSGEETEVSDPIPALTADAPAAEPDPEPEDVLTPAQPETKAGFFRRLMSGLDRTSSSLTEGVTGLFTKRKLDAETLQDLEDVLIQADLGVETAMAVTDRLSESRYQKGIEPDALRKILAEEVARVLEPVEQPFELDRSKKPFVVLVVGVNGTGKTTTIGKIAAKLVRDGRKVVLAAGDTFRAAAVEQLKIWGERTKSHVVARETGSDAAGLVYDALEDAAAAGADALLIDTAGRLQNRTELMAELEKVVRVIKKKVPDAPHAVLLVLDATTGQNALNQVEIFSKAVGVTGLVMTKLDGTARGGILVAISARHQLPVHFVGVGEGVDDLAPFSADDFATAIAGRPEGG